MLITPPGTSLVARTSAKETAGRGCDSEAITIIEFPLTTIEAIVSTKPKSAESSGAIAATTPVGSGIEKSKNGPATGLLDPVTIAILSAQPANQTMRLIASSTSFSACFLVFDHRLNSSTNCSRLPCMISETR